LWIAGIVAGVNAELIKDLADPICSWAKSLHEPGIDRSMFEWIWRYNVMPYIEDQLFESREIAKYRLGPVMERFREVGEELAQAADNEEMG